MSNVQNGSLVTVINYYLPKYTNLRNTSCLSKITVEEVGVSKSGKKTCMVNNTQWYHEDIKEGKHKEDRFYGMYSVVVTNPSNVKGVLQDITQLVETNNKELHEKLIEFVDQLENEIITVVDKR